MRIVTYSCAFCGEDNDVLVDPIGGRRRTFTEDCAVCCRPNLITLAFGDDGTVCLDAAQEYRSVSTEAPQLSSTMLFFMKVFFPKFWGSLRGQPNQYTMF
ncbi:MAG: CPXCG motif-containing cysteine-rich protein [Pseudomonadota bacterium]|nr:CPXCG motif-containing cysteine-rich protein [Pseudomonadota bacterium]